MASDHLLYTRKAGEKGIRDVVAVGIATLPVMSCFEWWFLLRGAAFFFGRRPRAAEALAKAQALLPSPLAMAVEERRRLILNYQGWE